MRSNRLGVSIATLAVIVGIGLLSASSATAYVHSWSCQSGSGGTCPDLSGQIFNPWLGLQAQMDPLRDVHQLCAKAVTAAGNLRSPAPGYSSCGYGIFLIGVCLISDTPDSQAYIYWDGPGGPYGIEGLAETPDSAGC